MHPIQIHAIFRFRTYTAKPAAQITFQVDGSFRAEDLARRLREGRPPVYADASEVDAGRVVFSPVCLRDDDVPVIASRVQAALGRIR